MRSASGSIPLILERDNLMKTIYTTGQVAKICKVAPRTVSKWFDSGRLRGYRIPGSQDRRIPREHLVKFLKTHGMPYVDLEEDDDSTKYVLMYGFDETSFRCLRGLLEKYDIKLLHSFTSNDIIDWIADKKCDMVVIFDPQVESSEVRDIARQEKVPFIGCEAIGCAHEYEIHYSAPVNFNMLANSIKSQLV